MTSNKGRGHKFNLMLNLKLKKGHFPRILKLMLLLLRNQVRRKLRVDVATYVVRKVTSLLHALVVTYLTQLLLMISILLGRIRLAMCLPSLLVLKVVSRKEPFG